MWMLLDLQPINGRNERYVFCNFAIEKLCECRRAGAIEFEALSGEKVSQLAMLQRFRWGIGILNAVFA